MNFFVYDTSGYNNIVSKFIEFINNHPYVVDMMSSKEEMIDKYISNIDNELKELNTYQEKIMNSIGQNTEGKMVVNSYNLAYNEMLELMKEKYNLTKEKDKIKPVSIISLNKVFDGQISILRNIIVFSFILLIIGFIILIVKETK